VSAAHTIAVIADTHMPRGRRRLPDACAERIRAADLVIHAGDFSTRETYEHFASLGPPLVAVHGNVDDAQLRSLLPARDIVELGGARIAVIHDAGPARGRLARMRRAFPDADAVIFGHSHIPLRESEAGFLIFNPGSPTERRRAPAHTMGVGAVRAGALELRHVEV